MSFTTDNRSSSTRIEYYSAVRYLSLATAGWRARLAEADLGYVHRCGRSTRYAPVKHFAVTMSKLGNGWIYPAIALVIFFEARWNAPWIFVTCATNVAIIHIVYPFMKKVIRRRRPFHVDPGLNSLLETLDEYSFPSGHVMTLSGVLLPVALSLPGAVLPALLFMGTMGWSRIATAHHFPSDVLAGAFLGAAIAYPVCYFAL